MSQMNSFEDSIASMSQDFDFQNSLPPPTPARGRGVTLATMRGVINLFNHYFKQVDENGNKKKMTRVEKHRRWISYKQKIWDEYGRRITGTYASETALIRRYSDPLTFLKYRLKRARNLRVSDLSQIDQAYYREIGGTEDVDELIDQTSTNIDSIRSFSQPLVKRPRLERPTIQNGMQSNPFITTNLANVNFQTQNRNHNLNHIPHPNHQHTGTQQRTKNRMVAVNTNVVSNVTQNVSSPTNSNNKKPTKQELDQAIEQVAGDMDIFEQEQLLKKKIEAFEMTQEKVRALIMSVKSLLSNEPQMIGAIPGIGCLDDQMQIFFDYWLNQYKERILSEVESQSLFYNQLMLLKADPMEYQSFLQKWKLMRMFKNDSFISVWKWMIKELNVSIKNAKEEADQNDQKSAEDVDDDDDILLV